jgi:hypothetical protein
MLNKQDKMVVIVWALSVPYLITVALGGPAMLFGWPILAIATYLFLDFSNDAAYVLKGVK